MCALCAGLSLPLACGTTALPDGSGGATEDGGSGGSGAGGSGTGGASAGGSPAGGTSSGGEPSAGGAEVGGWSGHGGEGGLGGGGQCPEHLGGDEYCAAVEEYVEQCPGPDADAVSDDCWDGGSRFDRMDACLLDRIIDCVSPCQPDTYLCQTSALIELHPDLVNEDVFLLCVQNPTRTDVDCSLDNKIEGAQQTCIDRAWECSEFIAEQYCIGANLVRPEFLPERDACLAGPCDELEQCLYDVIYGAPQ